MELVPVSYTHLDVYKRQGYIFGPEGNGFLRFNPACPRETLIKGLTLLKEGFEGK